MHSLGGLQRLHLLHTATSKGRNRGAIPLSRHLDKVQHLDSWLQVLGRNRTSRTRLFYGVEEQISPLMWRTGIKNSKHRWRSCVLTGQEGCLEGFHPTGLRYPFPCPTSVSFLPKRTEPWKSSSTDHSKQCRPRERSEQTKRSGSSKNSPSLLTSIPTTRKNSKTKLSHMDPEIFSPFWGLWTQDLLICQCFSSPPGSIQKNPPIKSSYFGLYHLGFTNASSLLLSQICPPLNCSAHTAGCHPETETSCKTKLSASPCPSLNCSHRGGLKTSFKNQSVGYSSLHSDLHGI